MSIFSSAVVARRGSFALFPALLPAAASCCLAGGGGVGGGGAVVRWWSGHLGIRAVLGVHWLLVSSAVDSSVNLAAPPSRRCVHLIWAPVAWRPPGFSPWLPVPAAPSARGNPPETFRPNRKCVNAPGNRWGGVGVPPAPPARATPPQTHPWGPKTSPLVPRVFRFRVPNPNRHGGGGGGGGGDGGRWSDGHGNGAGARRKRGA